MFERDLHWLQKLRATMNAPSVGGYTGMFFYNCVLRFAGKVGATIVLGAVYLVSLIYLTNFKLGEWCRELWATHVEGKPEPRRPAARRIWNAARAIWRSRRANCRSSWTNPASPGAVGKAEPSGLGADGRPVPEPTVRDLSVPQAGKTEHRTKKPPVEKPKEPAPAEEGVVIPAREVAAATTADILGKTAEPAAQPVEVKAPETAPPVTAETVEVSEPAPVVIAPKPKPVSAQTQTTIAVAGHAAHWQLRTLPPLDFLQFPDMTAKAD